jgi:hypothetical protein
MNFKVKFKEETPPFNVKFGWNNGEFEAGKAEGVKSEYDRFWDIVQPTRRTIYMYMFTYWDWEYGDPKKPIVIDNANISIIGMFYYCINLKTINAEKFDFVKVSTANNLFCWCQSLESVPKINLCSTNLTSAYANCYKLRTIGLLDVSGITVINGLNDTFKNCYALEDIGEVRGQISQNGLNLQWSTKLNKATIVRIVNALSLGTNGLTVTFSQVAKNNAFTDEEWAVLIGTKPNWTFSLA